MGHLFSLKAGDGTSASGDTFEIIFDTPDGEQSEVFTLLETPPAIAYKTFIGMFQYGAEVTSMALSSAIDLIFIMLEPESEQRFRALIADKKRIIGAHVLIDCASKILAKLGGRPFPPSAGSPASASSNGDGSAGDSGPSTPANPTTSEIS